jgi:hypothetical protein
VAARGGGGGAQRPVALAAPQRGSLVQAKPAVGGACRARVIQAYPGQVNNQTGKAFRVFDGKASGKPAIMALSLDEKHRGYIRYSYAVEKGTGLFAKSVKTCILEHIETDPETGTGLGPMLMLQLARKAVTDGCTVMNVSMPRYPKYYERFGFQMVKGKGYGTATPQEIIAATAGYVAKTWMNPKFADIYVGDELRRKKGKKPVYTAFPAIE